MGLHVLGGRGPQSSNRAGASRSISLTSHVVQSGPGCRCCCSSSPRVFRTSGNRQTCGHKDSLEHYETIRLVSNPENDKVSGVRGCREGRLDYDSFSQTDSTASGSDTRGSRSTKSSKTSFQLAHPPPLSKHKLLRLHTTLLLQLQQISDASRPIPALDVLSSLAFAPRLARRCPRILNGKNGLGPNDLVIVSSQTYDGLFDVDESGAGHAEDESCEDREVVAAICPLKKEEGGDQGKAEVCLNYGPPWLASPLVNGIYEFVSTDECGVTRTARWVPRYSRGRRRVTIGQDRPQTPLNDEKRFSFSIVNPESRRHAVIATLNRNTIDIRDQYPVQTNASTVSQVPSLSGPGLEAIEHANCDLPSSSDKILVDTDEHLQTLIVISGIWVAFREGYSQNFRYRDAFSSPLGSSNANTTHKHRVNSMNTAESGSSRAGTPNSQDFQLDSKSWQTNPKILHRSTASTSSTPRPAFTPTPSPRRAKSTGAAFFQRASSRNSNSARVARRAVVIPAGDSDVEQPTRSRRASTGVITTSPWQSPRSRKRQGQTDIWPASSLSPSQLNSAKDSRGELQDEQKVAEVKAHSPPTKGRQKKTGTLERLFCFIRKTSGSS